MPKVATFTQNYAHVMCWITTHREKWPTHFDGWTAAGWSRQDTQAKGLLPIHIYRFCHHCLSLFWGYTHCTSGEGHLAQETAIQLDNCRELDCHKWTRLLMLLTARNKIRNLNVLTQRQSMQTLLQISTEDNERSRFGPFPCT